MQAIVRAALVAIVVFWALCALFFVQPFTGQFLFFVLPAAGVAAGVFLALRSQPPPQMPSTGPDTGGKAAIVAGAILLLLGVMLAFGRWPLLWDPCHTFDDQSSSHAVSAGDPCSSSSSMSESRAAFIADSLAAEGTMMVGGALAVWAGLRGHRAVVVACAGAMVVPTFVLFRGLSMLFMVVFLLAITLVLAALMMAPRRRVEAPSPSA
jgi:LPXTG-motif cell wall-anchored protein